jgi:MFS family permease
MVVFATAGSVAMLLVARLMQGFATGAAMSALTAAMVDLQPNRKTGTHAVAMAPIARLGFGVAVSALLVEYAPAPRQLVYLLIVVVLVTLVLAVIKVVPETSTRSESRTRVTRTLIPRVSVPEQARSAFIAGAPALVATWALGGLMLALGTSITADRLGITNHAAGGALLAVFFFAATGATPLASASRRPMGLPASYACLGGGVALVLVAALTGSVLAYAVALVAAGAGFSTAYVGVISSLTHVPAVQRGQLFAAVYVVSYLAFGVPVVISGVAADRYGLGATVSGYAVFVLSMVALAAVALRLRRVPEPAVTRRDRAAVTARS